MQRSASRPGRAVAVALGGLLLLAGLAVLVLWLTAPRETASDAAQEYLEAVADGDVALANELVPALPSAEGSPADVELEDGRSPDVVPGWTPITDASVGHEFAAGGDAVEVEVRYVVGNAETETTLTVARIPSSRPFAQEWQVQDSLAAPVRVRTTVPGLAYAIGDLELTADDDLQLLALYPGTYDVTATGGAYLQATEIAVDVSAGLPEQIDLDPEPTDALLAELTAHVDERLERCAGRSEANLTECGADADGAPLVHEPVAWSVAEEPTLEERLDTTYTFGSALEAVYQGGETPDGPTAEITEQVGVTTQLWVELASPDAYEIVDESWRESD